MELLNGAGPLCGAGLNESAVVRRTLGHAASTEHVNVGLNKGAVPELYGGQHAHVAFAFEPVEALPMRTQLFGAEDESRNLFAMLVDDDARIADCGAPALMTQHASDRGRLPDAGNLSQHVRVRAAWCERAINKEPVGHGVLNQAVASLAAIDEGGLHKTKSGNDLIYPRIGKAANTLAQPELIEGRDLRDDHYATTLKTALVEVKQDIAGFGSAVAV